MHDESSGFGGSENEVYAFEHLLEAGDFALQMLDARGGDAIGSDAAVAGRGFPLRFDQVVFEHALERGVERALFDLKQLIGALLDVLDQRVSVHGLTAQGLEDHHFKRAAEEVAGFGF